MDDHHHDKLMELGNLPNMEIPPQFKTVDLYNYLEVLRLSGDFELMEKTMDLKR